MEIATPLRGSHACLRTVQAMKSCNIQNKSPFASALGDWFPEDLLLISKASPNGWLAIIIVIIIVVGEAIVFHKFAYYSTIFDF